MLIFTSIVETSLTERAGTKSKHARPLAATPMRVVEALPLAQLSFERGSNIPSSRKALPRRCLRGLFETLPLVFDTSSRQAANLARISMPTAKQKNSAPTPSCPATNRTEAMEGEGGDYVISSRKEESRRSHSIVRVALIAPGVRCKSWYCGLTHFRLSSFPPHVDPRFPRRSPHILAPRLLRIHAFPKRPDRPPLWHRLPGHPVSESRRFRRGCGGHRGGIEACQCCLRSIEVDIFADHSSGVSFAAVPELLTGMDTSFAVRIPEGARPFGVRAGTKC